jgi:hypothetical protein
LTALFPHSVVLVSFNLFISPDQSPSQFSPILNCQLNILLIIPAWPITSLSTDRITRVLDWGVKRLNAKDTMVSKVFPSCSFVSVVFKYLYWAIFTGFFGLMLYFVAPTFGKSYTIMSLLLVALLTLTPTDHRYAVLTFLAGAGLGYFLELWGTTRQCWTYYTFQTPPFFAVLAHGMAAVAFWRAGLMMKLVWKKFAAPIILRLKDTLTVGLER